MIINDIRQQTQANHTSLENSPLLRPISQKSLTLDQYMAILQKFYGFFFPMEEQIARFPVEQYLPDFASRRKASLLKNDLARLRTDMVPFLPLCHDLPAVETMDQAFGCLYVLEGSTLGGKMIYKLVKDTLGIEHTQGGSFFYGYGPETGSQWKIFQKSMEAVSASHPMAGPRMIEAANQTFNKLSLWLNDDTFSPGFYSANTIAARLSS